MKILFSPSEEKSSHSLSSPLNPNSFKLGDFDIKKPLIDIYNTQILDDEFLPILTGIKNTQKAKIYQQNLYNLKTQKAITLYSGVAYKYLDFASLDTQAQSYVEQNTIIFSNLFGAINADDYIPLYKLKQGVSLGDIKVQKYYKQAQQSLLDEYLYNQDILDLRAGVYTKFYQINEPHISCKFIKNGKVISHYAKAYRGIILRLLAEQNIQTFKDFDNAKFDNMKLLEIKQTKNKKEYIYEILS